MPVDIDTLQIKVETDSENAASGIQKLANTLERLKTATKGIGLGSVSTQMKALADAAEKLAGTNSASGKIQSLANSLSAMNRVPSLAAVSRQLTSLGEGMEALSSADFSSTKIQAVGGMLTGLASAPKLTGMTTVSKQLTSLADGLKALSAAPIDETKIQSIVSAMGSLAGIGKASGLNSTLNALKKLPTISAELDTTNLTTFATQMKEVAAAIRPLANEMQKVSNGFAAFPIRIQKIISSNAGLAASNQKAAKSFNLFGSGISGALAKMTLFGYSLKQVVSTVNGWVTSSYDYVENLNLFTVAMGDGADEALRYAEEVQKALGVDMSEFIRNQGVFKQVTSGFGVTADKANLMSKNLTQLGYDIASLFNVKIEDAMLRLQSGISGELEPLRRLGYALDVATLQQIAYEHGISQSINTMTQAQKSQLRYLAIMEQSGNAMGDMARTIDTGANRMRVLQQQFIQLSRAMGNLFVPIIEVVLPYVQAFVEVLTEAIHGLATLAGFKIPEVELPDLDDATGGLDDELEDANKAAKELRRTLTAFDELNILNAPKEEIKLPDNDLNVELPEYEFLKEFKNNAEELKEQMKGLLDIVLAVGAGLAAWGITNALTQFATMLKNLKTLQKLVSSTILVALEFKLVSQSYDDFLSPDRTMWDLLKAGLLAGVASWALYAMWGPAGLVLGIGVAAIAVLTSLAGKLASGDLKVGDFKTWLTAAIVAGLGGLAGIAVSKVIPGLSAFSGAVIGFSIGAAVVLSVINISAIAGGQYSAYSIQSGILTVLSSTFAGIAGATIAAAAGIATAGVGFAVGFGIALILNIIAISFEINKEEMRKHFGDIKLTDEQMQEWADRLTTSELTVKLDLMVDERSMLDSIKTQVESAIKELNGLNFRASIGISIDQTTYSAAVDNFIKSAQEYIQQQQVVSTMAVEILLDGTDTGINLTNFATQFYGETSEKLENLGQKLKTVVSDGFKDGEWIPEKLEEAIKLQKEIQEVLDYMSDIEFKAQMEALKLDLKGTDLTVESFSGILEKAELNIQEQMQNLEDVRLTALKVAVEQLDYNIEHGMPEEEAQKIYNQAVADADAAFRGKTIEINSATFYFGITNIMETYSSELAKAKPLFEASIQENLSAPFVESMQNGSYIMQGSIDSFIFNLQNTFRNDIAALDISTDARAEIKSLVNVLQPTADDLNEIAQRSRELGETVPKYVSDGLRDFNMLKSLNGNTEAILYTIGEKLSKDSAFLETMAKAEGVGKSLAQETRNGLLDNIDLVKDAAGTTIIGIRDTMTGEIINMTPELEKNLAELGSKIPDDFNASSVKAQLDDSIEKAGFDKSGNLIAKTIADGVRSGVGLIADAVRDVIKEAEVTAGTSTSSAGSSAGASRSTVNIASPTQGVQIPHYDVTSTAGRGRAFMGPETGAALVTQMNDRTAVAHDSQSSLSSGVSDANKDVVNVVYAMAAQIVRAIEDKDLSVNLDGEKIARTTNPYLNKINRLQGQSLVHK